MSISNHSAEETVCLSNASSGDPLSNYLPTPELRGAYDAAASAVTTRTSPTVQAEWAQIVGRLGVIGDEAAQAATLALFSASTALAGEMPEPVFRAWLAAGHTLYDDRPETLELTTAFFELSPTFVSKLSPETISTLAGLLAAIPPRPAVVAKSVLEAAATSLPRLDREQQGDLLTAAADLAAVNPWSLNVYFEAGGALLLRLEREARSLLLESVRSLRRLTPMQFSEYLKEAAATASNLTPAQLGALLPVATRLATRSLPAAHELLRNAQEVLARLQPEELEAWAARGEELLATHSASGVSFFKLQSRQAKDALAALSSGVTLGEVRDVLRMYSQALMGRSVSILSTADLQEGSPSWIGSERLDIHGTAIFAPSFMGQFSSKQTNFEAYKVLTTHQAGHLLYGTYGFTFERTGVLLRSLRELAHQRSGTTRAFASDFERFFDLFADQALARDLFGLAEDQHVDTALVREFRGIRNPFRRIQEHSLDARPPANGLPLRMYLMETLVRHTLRPGTAVKVPAGFAGHFETAARLLNLLALPAATVEDVTEAAMRLYVLVSQVPNAPWQAVPIHEWIELQLPTEPYDPAAEDLHQLAMEFARANPLPVGDQGDQQPTEGEEEQSPFLAVPQVPYRSDPRPELMQELLERLEQEGDTSGDGQPLDDAALELLREMVQEEAGDIQETFSGSEAVNADLHLTQSLKANMRSLGRQTSPLLDSVAEPEAQVFYYDEWDYRIRAYRPAWCRLYQRVLKEGSDDFYEQTLNQHPGLVSALRKQFEMMRPEGMNKVKRLIDGEEFDLDSVIESVVNRQAGLGLYDKVYWRRRRTERSVAVALLLDMSLSTDERVDQDFKHYMTAYQPDSLQGGPAKSGRSGKRIIDLEKESLVLLIEALERLGDSYGIYGFSSSGRSDVQFFMVKDLEETYTPQIRGRIDKIVPLQGTRMGAAIRHTVAKLERIEAQTKILLLLSDGRPQDRDYGTLPWELEDAYKDRGRPPDSGAMGIDGVMTDEKDYAVHDTKAALNEAKAKGMTPFAISIDKEGHDYLKAMCGDIGYEVVHEIESLPRRVPALYRRLTT